jgi:hypothetical protein
MSIQESVRSETSSGVSFQIYLSVSLSTPYKFAHWHFGRASMPSPRIPQHDIISLADRLNGWSGYLSLFGDLGEYVASWLTGAEKCARKLGVWRG